MGDEGKVRRKKANGVGGWRDVKCPGCRINRTFPSNTKNMSKTTIRMVLKSERDIILMFVVRARVAVRG